MRLVLFGAPGAGKGTQAERLVAEFGLLHLSTGEVLRKAIQEETALGKQARVFMDRGDLVPDDLVIGIVTEALTGQKAEKGFILDGFPRTIHQAEELERFLDSKGLGLTRVISLEVEEEELVSRINTRRESSSIKRADDNESTIRARFKAFVDQTLPLKKFYRRKGLLVEVDGSAQINEVYQIVRSSALGL